MGCIISGLSMRNDIHILFIELPEDDLGIISYLINPPAGCNFSVSNTLRLNCGVSFEMLKMRYKGMLVHGPGMHYEKDLHYIILGLNIGISF